MSFEFSCNAMHLIVINGFDENGFGFTNRSDIFFCGIFNIVTRICICNALFIILQFFSNFIFTAVLMER